MTSMELIDALGDIDEAFIADGAPVAKKTVLAPSPAWHWGVAAACLLLSAGFTWKLLPENPAVAPPESDLSSTTQPTLPTSSPSGTPSTAPSTTGTTDWEGVGGYNMDDYLYENDQNFNGLHGSLYEYICENFDKEQIAKITNEMEAKRDTVPYSYVGESTHFWVHELNIPRQKFVELNNKDKEFHKDRPWFLENRTFTDEEIDDIYTLSTKEFNEKYKAPTAVLVGEFIYNFNWLYKNDIDLWQKQGFTVEQLQNAV
ncbi:MAG: hypothetical protein J6K98_02425, partial [Clostridia bacterium]|nr:hypothetical protein [Clostridia bacterium]